MDEITIVGVVDSVHFGGVSKSAHEALQIRTPVGSYIFKVIGANPFEMSERYRDLCGKTVRASGFISGETLMVNSYSLESR